MSFETGVAWIEKLVERLVWVLEIFSWGEMTPSLFQVYDALEQRLVVAEASQRLRLPMPAKDGDVPEDDNQEWGNVSRSSFDSTTTSVSLSTTTTVHTTTASTASAGAIASGGGGAQAEIVEPGVGGVVNRFLGITPAWLRQTHLIRAPFADVSFQFSKILVCLQAVLYFY